VPFHQLADQLQRGRVRRLREFEPAAGTEGVEPRGAPKQLGRQVDHLGVVVPETREQLLQ
jgi:hypothetical protein